MLYKKHDKVDLHAVYCQSPFKKACGREVIFTIHYQKIHFFQRKLSKGIQKFMRVRKSVKNWSKIAIMKLEAVTINCK